MFGLLRFFYFLLFKCFFVQYTEQEGRSLGLSGWVQNTRQGSVIGQIQGAAGKVDDMSVTLWYLLLLVITRLLLVITRLLQLVTRLLLVVTRLLLVVTRLTSRYTG